MRCHIINLSNWVWFPSIHQWKKLTPACCAPPLPLQHTNAQKSHELLPCGVDILCYCDPIATAAAYIGSTQYSLSTDNNTKPHDHIHSCPTVSYWQILGVLAIFMSTWHKIESSVRRGVSLNKMPPKHLAVGRNVGHFIDLWLMGEDPGYCWWEHLWAGGKQAGWALP